MASLWILSIVLFAGAASASPSLRLGGERLTIERFPSLVQVDHYDPHDGVWTQSCAASVLTARSILSAASCFSGTSYERSWRRARAGSTYSNTGGDVVSIDNEYIHPTYGQLGRDGDICVVRLATPLTYSSVVQQVPIVPQGTTLIENLPVVHAGWGALLAGESSQALTDATVFTINTQRCAERYQGSDDYIVTENMICVGVLDVGKEACQIDSGGPLYFGNVLVGVVSWTLGCANTTFPTVGTSVGSYTNWIIANTV